MLACSLCGKPLAECCDIFNRYEDEEGREVVACGDCIVKYDLPTEYEDKKQEE